MKTFNVDRHKELLELERDAESQQLEYLCRSFSTKQLETLGVCLRDMRLASRNVGLCGKSMVKLSRQSQTPNLHTKISPGDIVVIVPSSKMPKIGSKDAMSVSSTGVATKVIQGSITIALDSGADELHENEAYCVLRGGSDVTYKRLSACLEHLKRPEILNEMQQAVFGNLPMKGINPASVPSSDALCSCPLCDGLNNDQRQSVHSALVTGDVALIHGPPGTGKTHTVAAFVSHLLASSPETRIIATAPSNVAADNLALAICSRKVGRVVRIGHPARVDEKLQEMTLDWLVEHSDSADVIEDVRTELRRAVDKRQWDEVKALRAELNKRERRRTEEIIGHASVVVCTLAGTADRVLESAPKFDWCIIDEAGQALEAACWIPILKADKVVLAGDDLQLPPTILSDEAAEGGLKETMFGRLRLEHGEKISRMLTIQYRMNQKICAWASSAMYGGLLKADDSVAERTLREIVTVPSDCDNNNPLVDEELLDTPVMFIDTSQSGFLEKSDEPEASGSSPLAQTLSASKMNEGEAGIVVDIIARLKKLGVRNEHIGVITPYSAQVSLIRQMLVDDKDGKYEGIDVNTVDGFQGREKEAIIMSFVRSNPNREIGFLGEDRRTNVAVTRAKRLLCIVCDSETVSASPFLKSLIDYCIENALYVMNEDINDGLIAAASSPDAANRSRLATSDVKKGGKQRKESSESISDEELVARLEKQILWFVENKSCDKFSFSADLNSFQRAKAHEIAEKYNIDHVSYGEGNKRHLVLTKRNPIPTTEQPPLSSHTSTDETLPSTSMFSALPIEPDIAASDDNNSISASNELSLNESKPQNPTSKQVPEKPQEKPPERSFSSIPPNHVTSAITTKAPSSESKEDENVCAMCHVDTRLHGISCRFCHRRYCYKHMVPETHGCGEAAKRDAQKQVQVKARMRQGEERMERLREQQKPEKPRDARPRKVGPSRAERRKAEAEERKQQQEDQHKRQGPRQKKDPHRRIK